MSRTLGSLMLCALCVACSDAAAPESPKFDSVEWTITESGSEQGGELCAGFNLSAEQARSFFDRARQITAEQLHDYDWLPCYVRGIAISAKREGSWEIRAGGTALVRWKDGATENFVCTECDDLLRD